MKVQSSSKSDSSQCWMLQTHGCCILSLKESLIYKLSQAWRFEVSLMSSRDALCSESLNRSVINVRTTLMKYYFISTHSGKVGLTNVCCHHLFRSVSLPHVYKSEVLKLHLEEGKTPLGSTRLMQTEATLCVITFNLNWWSTYKDKWMKLVSLTFSRKICIFTVQWFSVPLSNFLIKNVILKLFHNFHIFYHLTGEPLFLLYVWEF